jgi:hypothetical protein
MSPSAPSLRTLAQFFRYVLHPKQALLRHPDMDISQLERIPLSGFLMKLIDVDVSPEFLGGPSLSRILELMGETTTQCLFSIPDVCVLATALNSVGFPAAAAVPTSRAFEFGFFRLDVRRFEFALPAPRATRSKSFETVSSRVVVAARSIYKFMECETAREDSPESLTEFLRTYEASARAHGCLPKLKWVTHIALKLQQLPAEEFSAILDALDAEIRRQRETLGANHALLTGISRAVIDLDEQIDGYRQRTERAFEPLYNSLLGLFLGQAPQIQATVNTQKGQLFVDKKAFVDCFTGGLEKLKGFLAPIAPHTFSAVAAHFHSWLMQRLTLDEFIQCHEEYVASDELLTGVTKAVINQLCIIPAPKQLKSILAHPPLFQFCEIELLNAEFLELPIEAIVKIASAINLIQKMFELAHGCAPQADEMTPLFNFALLSSGTSKLFSLQNYLKHFIYELPQGDARMLNDQTSVALAHFIHHVESLAPLIEERS